MKLSSILDSVTGASHDGERYGCLLGMIADLRLSDHPESAEAKKPAVMLAIDYRLQSEGCIDMTDRINKADELYQAEVRRIGEQHPLVGCEISG